MTVKLVGSTSGSVSLQAPASTSGGAHRVLTLPDADGTVATTTTAGKILQVVQTVKTDAFSYNSTSFGDITGLTATITPSSNSNKILVSTNLYFSIGTGSGSTTIMCNLVRGSTNIAQPNLPSSINHQASLFSWSSAAYMQQRTVEFLDSPATTSATTYKVQIKGDNTSATMWLNRYYSSNNYRGISTITLMEVAA
tara:strand:- start:1058 stop:1645 length:588 start_codon:yes stop_codon:yes gene_type:complete